MPGRLQRIQLTQNQNAGPGNCIRWFGVENLRCPYDVPFSGQLVLPSEGDEPVNETTDDRSPEPDARAIPGAHCAVTEFDSAPLILWWDTGTHAAREESEFVELATAGLEMGTSGCFVATLGALNLGSRAFQVAFAVFGIKP